VIQIAARAANLKPPFPVRRPMVKLTDEYNSDDCGLRRRDFKFEGVSFISDCYTGGGASGAGQYQVVNGKYVLRGVNTAETDPNVAPFEESSIRNGHFNYSTAVEGEFLEEIYKRMNGFINTRRNRRVGLRPSGRSYSTGEMASLIRFELAPLI
jgi:hypothetical protein